MKAYSAYKQQFSLGQRTLLDLLDSANEMFVAKSDYVNTRYDRILSMYRVFASMGMLHKTFENDLPPETELIAMDNMPFMEEKANDAVAEEE